MSFKNQISKFLSYKPDEDPDFLIPTSPNNLPNEPQTTQNIFPSYAKNLEYIKTKYNLLINNDIVLKEFEITIKNKNFKACLLFIDGLVDSNSINSSLLEPLLLRNSIKMSSLSNDLDSKKHILQDVKKFNLKDFLVNNLIKQNSMKVEKTFENTFSNVNAGFSALFVETLDVAICVEAKKLQGRSITEPQSESIIRGSHESFVENIRTNTSLIRKIINNENLIIEETNVGKITKTKVAICYMKNIANDDLVAETKFRINNIDIDSLFSSGELENLIKDNLNNFFPEIIATERPDRTCNYLLNGRVAIIVNGSPYVLIVPAIIIDFLSSVEDLNLNFIFANFLKAIRIIGLFITIFLPGFYVAITLFHQEFLPDELLFAIVSSRENIPFSVIFEIIIMEISFELIREAGIRVPSSLGQTIGIVGALVLGEAAVSANIVSPILVIIIASTAVSEFTIPDFSFSFSIRIFRFIYILLGYTAGFLGIAFGIFVNTIILSNAKSFGIPYFSYTTLKKYPVLPIWKKEKRYKSLNTKRPEIEPKTSMNWRKYEK